MPSRPLPARFLLKFLRQLRMRRETLSPEALAKVDNCQRCGRCEEICPYDLPIMDLLPEKVRRYPEMVRQVASEQGHADD